MNNYKLSRRSAGKLSTCDPRIINILSLALKRSAIDFGIADGHRLVMLQQELFKQGKSKIDGITKKGKHNYSPSLAVDIYAYWGGKVQYDVESMCYIAGVIMSVAQELGYEMRWGGNWNQDGIVIHDQSFDDLCHFEIID